MKVKSEGKVCLQDNPLLTYCSFQISLTLTFISFFFLQTHFFFTLYFYLHLHFYYYHHYILQIVILSIPVEAVGRQKVIKGNIKMGFKRIDNDVKI